MSDTVKYLTLYRESMWSPVVTHCPFHQDSKIIIIDSCKGIDIKAECSCNLTARYSDPEIRSFVLMVIKSCKGLVC